MSSEPERTAVYRIRGERDDLLYIGMTSSVPIRWNGHEAVQPWWEELRMLTVVWYDSRPEAAAAEKAAILAEQPRYNVTYLKPGRGKKEPRQAVPVKRGLAVLEPRDDDEDLLNDKDVATMLRTETEAMARSALKRADGPAGFMLGCQRVWRKGEIRQWIADIETSQQSCAPAAGAA